MSKIKSCAESDGDRPPLRTKPPRIPPAVSGIQYNFCKNPACANYGIESKLKSKQTDHDFYTLSGGGKSLTLLKCKSCGERPVSVAESCHYGDERRHVLQLEANEASSPT